MNAGGMQRRREIFAANRAATAAYHKAMVEFIGAVSDISPPMPVELVFAQAALAKYLADRVEHLDKLLRQPDEEWT
jgi:trans-aconitate methyltransferase